MSRKFLLKMVGLLFFGVTLGGDLLAATKVHIVDDAIGSYIAGGFTVDANHVTLVTKSQDPKVITLTVQPAADGSITLHSTVSGVTPLKCPKGQEIGLDHFIHTIQENLAAQNAPKPAAVPAAQAAAAAGIPMEQRPIAYIVNLEKAHRNEFGNAPTFTSTTHQCVYLPLDKAKGLKLKENEVILLADRARNPSRRANDYGVFKNMVQENFSSIENKLGFLVYIQTQNPDLYAEAEPRELAEAPYSLVARDIYPNRMNTNLDSFIQRVLKHDLSPFPN